MGGTIKIAFRLHDGTVMADTRWTNNFPYAINSLEMINDDADYLRAFATCESDHRGDTTLAPHGYGLIVIDALTHKIYECNGYDTPGMTSRSHLALLSRPRGGDIEEFNKWEKLYEMGRLTAVDRSYGISIPLPRVVGRTLSDEIVQLAVDENATNAYHEIKIDISPWQVISFRETLKGWEAFREEIRDFTNLPFSDADDAAWQKFIDGRYG